MTVWTYRYRLRVTHATFLLEYTMKKSIAHLIAASFIAALTMMPLTASAEDANPCNPCAVNPCEESANPCEEPANPCEEAPAE